MPAIRFEQIEAPEPNLEEVAAEHRRIHQAFDQASSVEQRWQAVQQWDALRRRLQTWDSMAHVRFEQDTRNAEYKAARERRDQLHPQLVELDVRMKRKLLESPHRPELEQRVGPQAFALWESEAAAFDPQIKEEMAEEAKLQGEYTELLASAEFDFQGEKCNLSSLDKYSEAVDRNVRHQAESLRWSWFDKNRSRLDQLFDAQVKLRQSQAQKLGYENYITLAYKQLCRIDYSQPEVERFRAEVKEQIVPLAAKLRQIQAERLGVDKLMAWDEALFDPAGNPRPAGDHDWMVAQAQAMFDEMGEPLGEFFRMMTEGGLLDLKAREGKAGGGFCTDFPSYGVPFIFANFNGTKGDVLVFTHEAGHAFQNWLSVSQPLIDYHWPTYESCEIHSMSLEFLTWPHMEKFFDDQAERFRQLHLIGALLFLPYGVAVDHFQHLIYAQPEATARERFAMWHEMEQTYLPWRDWGDLPHAREGGRWQLQRHIYLNPFYYIDYTLAQMCALQFWVRSQKDFDEALQAYIALCRRGGEAPFGDLVKSAGLVSPFEEGCLSEVARQASEKLGL